MWRRDRVANLVVRLRQNVLRAGLARMGAAYSRISLADVASKLGVGSAAADAESIVAKVVRCGMTLFSFRERSFCVVSAHGGPAIVHWQLPHRAASSDFHMC